MVQEIKYQALSDYLTSAALYLGMKAAHSYGAEDHPVINAMVKSRKAFGRVSLLEESAAVAASMEKLQQFIAGTYTGEEEVSVMVEESSDEISQQEEDAEIPKKKKKQKIELSLSDEESRESDEESMESDEESVGRAEEYVQVEKIATQKKVKENDFEEMETLMDADDKRARRKNLRFYTAAIANNKKKAVISGDADIAYKSAKKKDIPRDTSEHEYNEISKPKKQVSAELDDYYRLAKKRRVNEPAGADKWMDPDVAQGARKITYEMMKNRGLTPYRKKEQRNPRVKNRNKYERATKKLSSFRRTAADPSQRISYSGETTGIKSRLARSIPLA
jgi:U3 small nucleolar RNA-associated protein 3